MKAVGGLTKANDGLFWISLPDYKHYFSDLRINHCWDGHDILDSLVVKDQD
jgi:hypothetical protein